ncbi:cupredoxin family protein [Niveibacterium sp. SC-1]|uniref:cupredoxin domain-containing protein n=1 Tax=Niveibacterium sp. SC-1 TaxID=3135646 RepID=UPI00311E616F
MFATRTRQLSIGLGCTLVLSLAQPAWAHDHGDHAASEPHGTGHAAALGKPGDPATATRSVEVHMSDAMRFSPATLTVQRGEILRLVVHNDGQTKHELVLGTSAELKEHAALMRKFPEMEHDDPNAVSVPPGETRELTWQFTKAGSFAFACLVPGHSEAGMKGTIVVKAAPSKKR